MARLKSALWVSAYLRRVSLNGAFGAVSRHGDDDAGAIFIRVDGLAGQSSLFSPVPQYLLHDDGNRVWTLRDDHHNLTGLDVQAIFEREARMDPDFWVVEVEDRQLRHFLLEDEFKTTLEEPGQY